MDHQLGIEQVLASAGPAGEASFFGRYVALKERLLNKEYPMAMAGFPGGNDHGPGHILRVLGYLDQLVGADPLQSLGPYELYIAMLAILYHDIGILRGRKGHAETSGSLLGDDENPYLFDSIDKDYIESAVVSHSSSAEITAKCARFDEEEHVRGHRIRPKLVAALVRLADELDEDARRGDTSLEAKLELSEQSKPFWRFNQRILGVKADLLIRRIEIHVAFQPQDLEEIVEKEGEQVLFLRFALDKLAKLNRERAYCNGFLPDALRYTSIHLSLKPIRGCAGWSQPFHVVMTDATASSDLEAMLRTKLPSALPSPGGSMPSLSNKTQNPDVQVQSGSDVDAVGFRPDQPVQDCWLPERKKFLGREDELAEIAEAMDPDDNTFILAILGIGGIGKTALALEAAWQEHDRKAFARYLFVTAKTYELTDEGRREIKAEIPRSVGEVFDHIAKQLERRDIRNEADPAQKQVKLKAALSASRTLLVLDNLETLEASDQEAICQFLRRVKNLKTIITTREDRLRGNYETLTLMVMSPESGYALIRQEASEVALPLDDKDVTRIFSATAGHPLAIRWVVRQVGLKKESLVTLLNVLATATGTADVILDFCFRNMWTRLSPLEKKILEPFGLVAGPLTETVVHTISGEPYLAQVREALTRLKKVSLVDQSDEVLDVQPLPRKFIIAELRRDHALTMDAKDRIAQIVLCYARDLARKGWAGFNSLDAQIESIQACIEWALTRGMENPVLLDQCSEGITALNRFWWYRGHWVRATDFAERAASMIVDPKVKAAVALVAAWLLNERNNNERALIWAERAVSWAPSVLAFRMRSRARLCLGQDEAAEQDILKSQELGSPAATHDLGNLRTVQGRRDEAEALYRAVLNRSRQVGEEGNTATACYTLGGLLMETNREEEGERLLVEAESCSRTIGMVMLLVSVLEDLARHRHTQGNTEFARKLAQEAQSIRRRVGVSTRFADSLFESLGLT